MQRRYFNLIVLISALMLVWSCKKKTETTPVNPLPTDGFTGKKVVYIMNEGNFQYGNASLTAYLPETKEVYNEVFYYANNESILGDVAQSMTIYNDKAFLVVNNSHVVYVIDPNTAKFTAKIAPLTSPRYVEVINDSKAYITDLYAKEIAIINPQTYEIKGSIPTPGPASNQHNTEQMVQYKNLLFACCWSYDNQVLVIDTDTDKIIDSITVGKQPNSLVIDKNNKIWAMCGGGYNGTPYGQEKARLMRIDPESKSVDLSFEFPDLAYSPSELQVNQQGDYIYFLLSGWNKVETGSTIMPGGVYKMSVDTYDMPQTPLVPEENNMLFYGLGVDPATNEIYVADAIDYVQKGVIYHYSAEGNLIHSFKAGIIPGAFAFRQSSN